AASPFGSGLRYNEKAVTWARRPSARGGPWPVRDQLRGESSPAGLLQVLSYTQQLTRFSPKAAEFFVLRLVLVHPRDCLAVPLARFIFSIQLPLGHGQKEPIETIAPYCQLH